MATDETSKVKSPLTSAEDADEEKLDNLTEEGEEGSTEPPEETEEEEKTKNWQHALQLAREREKKAKEELEKLRKEAREKKLAELSELERYKTLYQQEAQKRAELELRSTVEELLKQHQVSGALADVIREAPWAVPQVKQALGSEPTWEETIEAVKEHLPLYLQSFKKPKTESEAEMAEEKPIETERSDTSRIVKKRAFTRAEIRELSADPVKWEKMRDKVLGDLSSRGGVLPE